MQALYRAQHNDRRSGRHDIESNPPLHAGGSEKTGRVFAVYLPSCRPGHRRDSRLAPRLLPSALGAGEIFSNAFVKGRSLRRSHLRVIVGGLDISP